MDGISRYDAYGPYTMDYFVKATEMLDLVYFRTRN